MCLKNELKLKAKLPPEIIKIIAASIDVVLLFIIGVIFIFISANASIVFLLVGIGLMVLGLCNFISNWIIFYLFENELIIKYPLSLNLKTESKFNLIDIQEIYFGKGRLTFMRVKVESIEKIFLLNLSEKNLDFFIAQLSDLGVKVIRENI